MINCPNTLTNTFLSMMKCVSFNGTSVFKVLTCFSDSHSEISVVQFLFSFVVCCLTVALVHNNKLQSLLVLDSSLLRTQDLWKGLWWWKTGLGDSGQILCQFHHQCVRSIPVLSLVSDESSAAKTEQVPPLYRTEWLVLQLCWPLALRRWGTDSEQLKETHSLDEEEPGDIQSSFSPPLPDTDFTHLKWEPRGRHFVQLSWWGLGWVCSCKGCNEGYILCRQNGWGLSSVCEFTFDQSEILKLKTDWDTKNKDELQLNEDMKLQSLLIQHKTEH